MIRQRFAKQLRGVPAAADSDDAVEVVLQSGTIVRDARNIR